MKLSLPQIKLLIFITSAIGSFGSLYFSEILNLPPCSLCWYQRVFFYPIAIISLVDILRNKFEDLHHELVLSLGGLSIAIYHNLLYYGFIENIVPCSQGVPCTSRQIEWLGFITIPMLSLAGFISVLFLIAVNSVLTRKNSK